ncbi:hypothetical protein NHX12_034102 [Muraenolepis orangiensis]|uniref:Uncharacterized protein n=1 Tax=Muraenolepis orangiensis TaxID=630683 RepID=A0A9Q0E907_9TELE|nr:hypothetical protein NHX12_034102 [Muraenolepis orangiensis]
MEDTLSDENLTVSASFIFQEEADASVSLLSLLRWRREHTTPPKDSAKSLPVKSYFSPKIIKTNSGVGNPIRNSLDDDQSQAPHQPQALFLIMKHCSQSSCPSCVSLSSGSGGDRPRGREAPGT